MLTLRVSLLQQKKTTENFSREQVLELMEEYYIQRTQIERPQIDDYQSLVTKVKKYPPGQEDLYLLGKLTEECGEIGKEIIRKIDGKESQKDLTSEIGDLFWVLTAIAEQNGIKMSEVIEVNLEKLNQRNLL